MSSSCSWLPELIIFSGNLSEWDTYLTKIYDQFKRDFIYSYAVYNGVRVGIRKFPLENEREQAFFHLTTYGKDNTDRDFDLRRCERISWPKPIIEHAQELKVWKSGRKTKSGYRERINIATPSFDYLVVLEPRTNGYTLVTAFYLEYENQREAKRLDYEKGRGRT